MNSPQSPEDAIRALLSELEALCAEAEKSLRARDWVELNDRLADQRRVRQAIVNGLDALGFPPNTAPQEVLDRLNAIYTFRNDQLRRLTTYRDEVSSRLQRARKWKDIVRSA